MGIHIDDWIQAKLTDVANAALRGMEGRRRIKHSIREQMHDQISRNTRQLFDRCRREALSR
jgi:hypothetical protein